MIALIPWLAAVVLLLFVFRLQRFGAAVTVPVFVGLFLAIFPGLERIVVYERCGFRCKRCGYDLRGQVEPCCPECGRAFDDDQLEQMKLVRPEEVVRIHRSRTLAKWVGIVAIIIALLVVLAQGLHLYIRGARSSATGGTQRALDSVLLFAEDNNGRAPRHALEHCRGDYLLFLAGDSATSAAGVPVPGGDLTTFDRQTPKQQADTTRKAALALPKGTIAHRVGDFVFTYHGVDFNNVDPGLWLVVRSFDPGQNPPPRPDDPILVGLVDGTVKRIRAGSFSQAMIEQNALRARSGLAPLPDPATVTHAAPAVASR